MASVRKHVLTLALLIVVCLLPVELANAQNNLIYASRIGDLAQVQALLAVKADVNAKAADGTTALMAAAWEGQFEVVRTLLAAKAD
jgi:uncharacterized protein